MDKEQLTESVYRTIVDVYDSGEKGRDMLRMALGSVAYRNLETLIAMDKAEDARIIKWITKEESLQG